MLGASHATSGAAAGLAIAHWAPGLVGVHTPREAFAFATVVAGASMLPDLDHPSSTATRRFSWASQVTCRIVRPLSAFVFQLTRTRRDTGSGKHRGLTHTWLGAAAAGVAVSAATHHWGTPAVWVLVFFAAALVVKGMDDLIPGPPSLVAAGGYTALLLVGAPGEPAPLTDGGRPWLGVAVALGMAIHTVGDGLTESGAPILAPLNIGGRRWAPIGPPKMLRFHTGGPVEWVILLLLSVATVWLAVAVMPGGPVLLEQMWAQLVAG